MTKFVVNLLAQLAANPEIQAAIKKIFGDIIAEKIVPLVPLAVGSAVGEAFEQIVEHIPGVELKDLPSVEQIADKAMGALNEVLPFDLPFIGNLSDLWPH